MTILNLMVGWGLIQSINVKDVMKHLKTILYKIICLCKGHKWIGITGSDDNLLCYEEKCTRCGKIKEEVI